MIFYFSGTGNSQLAAKQIAQVTGDELISINDCLKKKKPLAIPAKQPLVFVAPTYAYRIPKVVEQWIRDTPLESGAPAYFILTCGGTCGNAGAYAKKLCAEKGLRFYGLASVLMPENYLAMFPTPNEAECLSIIEKAKPRLAEIARQIKQGEPLKQSAPSPLGRFLSGPVNYFYYPLFVHDKSFTVSGGCIACGKCARRCPLNNITMEDKRPVWNGNCTHCMACIAGCPTQAIAYKAPSKKRHHHFIMEEE